MPIQQMVGAENKCHDPGICDLSIVMPCLNEAETLGICIKKAQRFLKANRVSGEVIVADNGSSDGSQEIARENGARVVDILERGYGSALMGGINAARGKFVIMGDADDSYDFSALDPFLEKLREGYELVMGNRFRGGIKPGAMPALHKYLGNPVLTGIGRLFFRSPMGDFHCGLRGFSKEAIKKLHLQTTGMEFASEMVVKATLHKLRMAEVPTTLSPDGRSRPPHLRSWRDGWRHLRFLLIYSPRWLFLYPGLAIFALGVIGMLALLWGPVTVLGVGLDIHTMLYASLLIILGLQTLSFGVFSKVYGIFAGLLPKDPRIDCLLRHFSLEKGIIIGVLFFLAGVVGSVHAFGLWEETSFGALDPQRIMRITIPSLSLCTIGVYILFSSFFLSILTIRSKHGYESLASGECSQ
ncbi:Glycosyltransferase involved in cell wall bisynthesis [Desulfonatronum zhilinae]|nr:Glycosyltransferase involved in cell wall bisynthesis [Desulfonatronum zhilinae]